MRKYMFMALLLLAAVPILAQQTRVNIQYDPQRNTEGILPFSTQVLSPEVLDDHTVIFRVKAPEAKSVQLTGSMFVGKEARKRVDFTKGDDGVWTLTLGPLAPEIYFYYIIIDGVQNIDANNEFTGHAAMPSFSMLFVHGDVGRDGDVLKPGFGYVFRPDDVKRTLSSVAGAGVNIVFVGHTHEPAMWRLGNNGCVEMIAENQMSVDESDRCVINVGTVGCPRSVPFASYAVVGEKEDGSVDIELRKLSFDYLGYRDSLLAANAYVPIWLEDFVARLGCSK